jgi:hypothetical protein
MSTLASGDTQTVTGALIVQGGFGKLVNINSTSSSIPWKLNILGDYSIDYASIQNTTNINTTGPPMSRPYTHRTYSVIPVLTFLMQVLFG